MATKKPTTPATAPKPDRKTRERVPENESKADRFRRIGKKRAAKAVKAVQALAALGGSGYESTPEQRAKIVTALGDALQVAVDGLNRVKASEPEFDL